MVKFFNLCLLFLISKIAFSQPDLNFIRYTTEHGLANNDVICICQDNFGFLWFGTKRGCSRFDGIQFKNYTYHRNMPGSIGQGWVNDIVCDKQGGLWFALAGTGSTFMQYDYEKDCFIDKSKIIQKASKQETTKIDFWNLYPDSKGLIWFHAIGFTLGNYCPETNEVNSYFVNGGVSSILEDANHNLWLASGGQGLVHYNRVTKIFTSYKYNPSDPNSLSSNKCYSVFRDSDKQIWVGTKEGLNLMIAEPNDRTINSGLSIKFKRYQYQANNPFSLSSNLVYDIIEDKKGNLLIATVDGLSLMDNKREKIYRYYTDEIDNESINSNLVRDLFCDKNNNIWAGTNLGIGKLHIKKFKSYSHSSYKNSISHNKVQHIFQVPDSNIWISTPKGIDVFNLNTRSFQYKFKVSRVGNGLSSPPLVLHPNGSEGVFIGTWGGGLHYFDFSSNKISNYTSDHELTGTYSIFSLYLGSKNKLWIGTANNGLSVYNKETGQYKVFTPNINQKDSISSNRILSIIEDNDSTMWIGTHEGLNKLMDFSNGLFEHYLDSLIIYSILEGSNKSIWVGTNVGLYQYKKHDQSFSKCDIQDGFNEAEISGILEDDAKNLWISTNNGLVRFSLSGDTIHKTIVFRKEEGLTIDNFLPRSCTKLNDGQMAFGGSNGFCLFHPEQIKKDTIAPTVVFTKLKITNKTVKVGDTINNQVILPKSIEVCKHLIINHKNNEFAIEFTGLQYNMPKYNHYAYRLEGYDILNTRWHNRTVAYPMVEYMNLPSGDYTLKVKAANSYGIWCREPAELKITILPPWWKTIWFTVLWIVVFIATIFFYTTYRTYNLNKQKQILEKTVAERTMQLQEMNLILEERQEELETQARQMVDMNNELKQTNKNLEVKTSEVEEMAQKIHESDQKQLRFFANISHEFRTPLALIIGPLEKYVNSKKTNTPHKLRDDYIHLMYKNAKRLLRLINQIIDLRKIDQGGKKLNLSNNNIVEFVHEIANAFSPLAETKQIKIRVMSDELRVGNEKIFEKIQLFTLHSTLFTLFWFDPGIMEKILYNLISNAIKYTPGGGEILITIGVVVETRHALSLPNTKLAIKISDTGIGIKPENINKIFERFYRVETHDHVEAHGRASLHENHADGTGIGLSYTKELVDLHKGSITVESQYGEGTSFTISFPMNLKNVLEGNGYNESEGQYQSNNSLSTTISEHEHTSQNTTNLDYTNSMIEEESVLKNEITEESEDKATNHIHAEGNTQKPSILLVEDNPDLRSFIKSELKEQYIIFEAVNGQDGWEKTIAKNPNLILSDIMMPIMNGIELCKKIKTHQETSHIPVILLTAKSGEENIYQGLETGANDYITKPFSINILKTKIKNLFQFLYQLQHKYNHSLQIIPSEITQSKLDKEFIEKAIRVVNENMHKPGFDNDTFVELIHCSKTTTYRKIKAITDQSVSEFIRTIRLKKAAQLFLEGNDNIAEVCYKVGFKHQSILSRYFNKMFGKTPTQFIKDRHV